MTAQTSPDITLTAKGCLLGARLMYPVLPATIALGTVFGTVAAQKGLTFLETILMNSMVFAGVSQFVAMEVYRDPVNLSVLVGMVAVVAAVNMRMLLIGASLRPWLGRQPAHLTYPALFFLTDINWIVSLRQYNDGHRDWGVFLGSGLFLWCVWSLAAVPGYFFGSLIDDPRVWGLDAVLPAFFAAMLVPIWKGHRQTVIWSVAGLVAAATWYEFGGYWGIFTGAIAGALCGAFWDD